MNTVLYHLTGYHYLKRRTQPVLIVPVVQGMKELVFLLEKESHRDFPRASHIEHSAFQQELRRDRVYQADHFEM